MFLYVYFKFFWCKFYSKSTIPTVVVKKFGAAMTIVNNFYGSKAMLMVSGRDSTYANTATSEYGIMHDPDDPSSFTFHKMEMEDLELSFYSSPIAELEDEIIAVHTTDKKVYQWDKEKSKFKDTTETVTKIDHGLNGGAWFKTTTRWDGTACNKNPWKYSNQFTSCLDAFKRGLLLPNPGTGVKMRRHTGTNTRTCYGEDPYATGNKCPDGWTGKQGDIKCMKWVHRPEDNANAARYVNKPILILSISVCN